MTLRICAVTVDFYPEISGGTGVYVYELSRALARLGNEVHVICGTFGSRPKEEEVDNVYVHRIPLPSKTLGFDVLSFNSLAAKVAPLFMKEYGIDIIQGHSIASSGIAYLRRFVIKDIPFVYTVHNVIRADAIKARATGPPNLWGILKSALFPFAEKLDEVGCRKADRIIAISSSVAGEVCKHYKIPLKKIHVIYNGIDVNRFNLAINGSKIREKLQLVGDNVVLFVGRLVPQKGIKFLIEAVPRVLQEVEDVKFLIAGFCTYENYKQYLIKLSKKLGIYEHVLFLGYVPDTMLPCYYAAADICVVPSVHEPLGNVILEAMACGKPVIATKVGGIPEILTNKVGILIEPANADKLADAIIHLLTDPTAKCAFSHAGHLWVKENFSWETTARKTMDVFGQVLKDWNKRC